MKYLLTVLLCCVGLGLFANFKGPFVSECGLAFYFVHKGGDLEIKMDVSGEGKAVVRFYDAEEDLVKWDYVREPGELSYKYAKAPAGIYQVRYSGEKVRINPQTVPQCSFGVMALTCFLQATAEDQYKESWFLIPPNAKTLKWLTYGGKVKFFDASGKDRTAKEVNLADAAGEVWRAEILLKPNPYNRFGASGIPMILCPDAETAKAINSSLEKTTDGVVYPHKFQVKLHEYLKTLGNLDIEIADWRKYEKEFAAEPNVSALFSAWGLFRYFPYVLKGQNIDPASPEFGKSPNSTALAVMLSLDKPFNPYYGNPVLEKRLLAAVSHYLFRITEGEAPNDSWTSYSGGYALGYVSSATAFGFGAPMIKDAAIRKVWENGIRRIGDRFSMFRVSCENQSSHWPYAFTQLAKGSGEKGYFKLAEDFIAGMSLPENNPFMKTGYQQEAYGPDATYQGLGLCYQALYYRITGDENAKKGLQIVYNLMNHTVAPEPDGSYFGASNFSHRTKGSWMNRQYGGGLGFMQGELPEAAVFSQSVAPAFGVSMLNPANKPEAKILGYTTAYFSSLYTQYFYPSKPLEKGILPAQESGFVRNFNDEFIAVRKPGYYTLFYTGNTDTAKARRPKVAENKSPNNKWMQTQGMSLFWTPDYGSLVTAMNWSGDTGNFVRADLVDGNCAYSDYMSLKRSFKDEKLTLENELFQCPAITVKREVTFGDYELVQNLTLSIGDNVEVKDLYEQIPFLRNKKDLKITFEPNENEAKSVAFTGNGKTLKLTFDRPVKCSFGPETKFNNQMIGALRIHFGNKFTKGENISLKIAYQTEQK